MRRVASAVAAALVLVASGCGGGGGPSDSRWPTLDAFFSTTQRGRAWAGRFPHRPGSRPCTALDKTVRARVKATCSTDAERRDGGRVLATFTVSWSHGSRARTWFVLLRRDGSVVSIRQENPAG